MCCSDVNVISVLQFSLRNKFAVRVRCSFLVCAKYFTFYFYSSTFHFFGLLYFTFTEFLRECVYFTCLLAVNHENLYFSLTFTFTRVLLTFSVLLYFTFTFARIQQLYFYTVNKFSFYFAHICSFYYTFLRQIKSILPERPLPYRSAC
jgi:hypothetical protein